MPLSSPPPPWGFTQICIAGADPEFFFGGGRGGEANFDSEETVEPFCGKLFLTETTMCSSICERCPLLVQEILPWEQTNVTFFGKTYTNHFLLLLENIVRIANG